MKNFIIQLAKRAGQEIAKKFNRDKIVQVKQKGQIVTGADLIADKIIVKAIKQKFPTHSILSEESGRQKRQSEYIWVIDPLDGTTNYSIGSPLFAISIALFKKDQPILAVTYAPQLNELYFAEVKKNSELNGKKIKVSLVKTLKQSFLTYCHGSKKKDIKRAVKIYNKIKFNSLDSRQLGAASLELSFVAAGRTDCIIIPGANSWDVGAGILIVRQAGGKVTDFQGREWNLKSKDMVASNGKIHNQLLKFLKNM